MNITRRLIISNTLYSSLAMGITQFINFLILPLFITKLGAELYGIWVVSNVVMGYMGIFDLGFTQGLQKYVAEARVKNDARELSEVVVSGLVCLFAIGLLLSALLFLGAEAIVSFFNISSKNEVYAVQLLKISALFSVLIWPLRISQPILYASMRISQHSICETTKMFVQSIFMLGMVYWGCSIISIKWVTLGMLVVFSFPELFLVFKYVPEIQWDFSCFKPSQLKRMLGFSFGMFYNSLMELLTTQVDVIIIGKFLSMEAVAAYAILEKPYKLVKWGIGLMASALLPSTYILNANKDKAKLQNLLHEFTIFRTFIALPVCLTMIQFIPDFLRLWVGKEFIYVSIWARLFLFIPILACLGIGAIIASASGHYMLVNSLSTIRILLNLALSLIFIHHLGVGGPVAGTFLSMLLLGNLTFFPLLCKKSGLLWHRTFFEFVRSAGVCFISYFLTTQLFQYFCFIPTTWLSLGLLMSIVISFHFMIQLIFTPIRHSIFRLIPIEFLKQGVINAWKKISK